MPDIRVELGDRSYTIRIRPTGLDEMVHAWAESVRVKKALIVSDDTVWDIYGPTVYSALKEGGIRASAFVFPAGEPSKSLDTLTKGWDACFAAELDRHSHIVALGGGVVGDLAGFLAASYLRGIAFIQIPTTLLAQVDSSVGGKTGINHERGKNTIGAFHQPTDVFVDISTLTTLPEREVKAGLAEVVKYGVIRDAEFFEWMETHTDELNGMDADALVYAVEKSCRTKADIVADDEREAGLRAILNYGHTFAHAIETATHYTRYLHGEAVAIGMRLAGELAVTLQLWRDADRDRQQNLLDKLGLDTSPCGCDPDVLRALMNGDKKTVGGKLNMILPTRIGAADIVSSPDESALMDVLTGA